MNGLSDYLHLTLDTPLPSFHCISLYSTYYLL